MSFDDAEYFVEACAPAIDPSVESRWPRLAASALLPSKRPFAKIEVSGCAPQFKWYSGQYSKRDAMFNAKCVMTLGISVTFFAASISAADVSGLILKIRTEHDNLDRGTEVKATVWADGKIVAKDVVVAKGEVAENTDHPETTVDFTKNVADTAKFKIDLTHPGIEKNSDPHWRMSFSAKAKMSDKTKRSTTLDMKDSKIYETKGRKHLNFEGKNRSSGEMPFTVE